MDEKELTAIVERLDREIPKEGAVVRFDQYCDPESRIVASARGYQRLGVEMLKAATVAGSEERPDLIEVDLEYLHSAGSEIRFSWFERREIGSVDDPGEKAPRWQQALSWVVFAGCAVGAILAVIGLVGVGRWLVGLL